MELLEVVSESENRGGGWVNASKGELKKRERWSWASYSSVGYKADR